MKPFLSLLAILLSMLVSAQNNTITKKKFHLGGAESDTIAGYTQAIQTGNILYISGTVGFGKTMAEQLKTVYQGVDRTLKHYGLGAANIVKENLYTTGIEATKAANPVRKLFYKGDYPAATWVQISRLYMREALVEVEVIAHFPAVKGNNEVFLTNHPSSSLVKNVPLPLKKIDGSSSNNFTLQVRI